MISKLITIVLNSLYNFFRKIFSEWLKIKKEEKEIEEVKKEFKVDSKEDDFFDDERFNNR